LLQTIIGFMAKKDTASQMHKLVKQFRDSGQSQKEFAAAHGLKEGKLYYWISKLSKSEQSVTPLTTPKKDFVAIEVTPEQEGRNIMIRLKSGVEIEIPL
jgi:transposase-like protein